MSIMEAVESVVCSIYGTIPKDLPNRTRKREICESRQLCAVISYSLSPRDSLKRIANRYGLKNHATIIQARKKLFNLYQMDNSFRNMFTGIRDQIAVSVPECPSCESILNPPRYERSYRNKRTARNSRRAA